MPETSADQRSTLPAPSGPPVLAGAPPGPAGADAGRPSGEAAVGPECWDSLAVTGPPAEPAPSTWPTPPGYEVLGELGRGGMGVVYRARQVGLNRLVALKMVLAGGHAGAEELGRFRHEAEAVARLRHPNIVTVHEVGDQNGLPFFSLEYCDGGS